MEGRRSTRIPSAKPQTMKAAFSRSAALHGALMAAGSTYVSYALGLVISVLVARALGPAQFGQYSYVVWLSGLFVIFANHGLTTSGIRFVSESLGRGEADDARRVHAGLRRWQFASLVLVTVVFALALHWLRPAGWSLGLAWFAALVVASAAGKTIYLFDVSIAKGYGKFAVEPVSTVLVTIANALAVVALVTYGAGLAAYVGLFAVTSAGYAVVAAWMLRKVGIRPGASTLGGLAPGLSAQLRRHLSWTIVLVLVAAVSNKSVEMFLLNYLVGPAQVGFFSIAAALTRGGVEILSSGLSAVLLPMMGHAFGSGGARRVGWILSDAVRYFQFIGLLLAGVGFLWAHVGVHLMYGTTFDPVAGVFQVMVVVGGLTLADGAFGALLTSTDHQRLRATIAVGSVAVSAACALILVPRYGLAGAVGAHAVSRLLIFAILVIAILRTMALQMPWRELGRLYLAAVIAGGLVALALWKFPGLVAQAIGGFAYGALFIGATIALGAWRGQDIAMLASLVARIPMLHRHMAPMLQAWQERANMRSVKNSGASDAEGPGSNNIGS
jgi:O-antigen/teichoic acid export membrane protein